MDLKFEGKQKTKPENENKQIRTTLIKKNTKQHRHAGTSVLSTRRSWQATMEVDE